MNRIKHSTPLPIDATAHSRIDAVWDAVEMLRVKLGAFEKELIKVNVKIGELLLAHYNKQSEEQHATSENDK